MTTRQLHLLVFLVGPWLSTGIAWGDGSMFVRWNHDADILQPTQKVYIHHEEGLERLVIQTKYEGPAEEMVWLVPVPAQPTVERGDPNLFKELGKATRRLDISHTDFVALRFAGGSVDRGSDPVEWRRRIGDYDVVLLAPIGEEDVIAWLNANEFGVPEEATPILADYIANQWWMVAARIHPDALTEITEEALANGTLHPLDMTFESSECVYPLRLPSLAAGPVEELIYIEGPSHYQPATLAHGDWSIEVHGGPTYTLPDEYAHSAVDQVEEILTGRVMINSERYLTKLRRVFEPEEMTDDLIFEAMDYTRFLASNDANRIAQAATQLGRHRDPAGMPGLVAAIAPAALEQAQPQAEHCSIWLAPSARILSIGGVFDHSVVCQHLRSCIWALGEIGIQHAMNPLVETALLRCARHDSQLIRMEAYTALIKLRARSLGPTLSERLGEILESLPTPMGSPWWPEVITVIAEMDMLIDWIERFGTIQQKESVIKTLSSMLESLSAELETTLADSAFSPYRWAGWIVWRAALTPDPQLLVPLQDFRDRLGPETVDRNFEFLLTAEAACGSSEAFTLVVQHMAEDPDTLHIRDSDGHAYIPSLTRRNEEVTLRQWTRWQAGPSSPYYDRDMPSDIRDTIARTALETEGLSDWRVLYVLGHIASPLAEEHEHLMDIWDRNTGAIRVVAVDLLYAWGDSDTLLQLYEETDDLDVQAEITWALEELGIWKSDEPYRR